jgi:hypothetical protein
MRFMVIVKANEKSENGQMPNEQELVAMGKLNEKMIKAGVMIGGEGLHPSSRGMRVQFDGGKRTVTDGPFAETKELVGGYWILQVKSKEEVLEWVKQIPFTHGEEVEIRKVFEPEDFAPAVKTEAGKKVIEDEKKWQKEHGQK